MTKHSSPDEQMRAFARAPEAERKSMVKDTIDRLLSEPEVQRLEHLKQDVLSATDLEPEALKSITASLVEVLVEMPETEREEYLVSRVKAGAEIPEDTEKLAIASIVKAITDWPEDRRDRLIGYWEKAYQTAKLEVPDFKALLAE